MVPTPGWRLVSGGAAMTPNMRGLVSVRQAILEADRQGASAKWVGFHLGEIEDEIARAPARCSDDVAAKLEIALEILEGAGAFAEATAKDMIRGALVDLHCPTLAEPTEGPPIYPNPIFSPRPFRVGASNKVKREAVHLSRLLAPLGWNERFGHLVTMAYEMDAAGKTPEDIAKAISCVLHRFRETHITQPGQALFYLLSTFEDWQNCGFQGVAHMAPQCTALIARHPEYLPLARKLDDEMECGIPHWMHTHGAAC